MESFACFLRIPTRGSVCYVVVAPQSRAHAEPVCTGEHSTESALPIGGKLVSDEPCPAPNGLVNKDNLADSF